MVSTHHGLCSSRSSSCTPGSMLPPEDAARERVDSVPIPNAAAHKPACAMRASHVLHAHQHCHSPSRLHLSARDVNVGPTSCTCVWLCDAAAAAAAYAHLVLRSDVTMQPSAAKASCLLCLPACAQRPLPAAVPSACPLLLPSSPQPYRCLYKRAINTLKCRISPPPLATGWFQPRLVPPLPPLASHDPKSVRHDLVRASHNHYHRLLPPRVYLVSVAFNTSTTILRRQCPSCCCFRFLLQPSSAAAFIMMVLRLPPPPPLPACA